MFKGEEGSIFDEDNGPAFGGSPERLEEGPEGHPSKEEDELLEDEEEEDSSFLDDEEESDSLNDIEDDDDFED